ncbi:histidine phosphatase family protein [Macrococcus brunensis]|uniref:histidine phosphatase family protein n=1 Tax=Macrococcus brunensis TaxID=198483 RepID=UPI001EF03DB9|nr:histidine phosphatase family protein [Macrococcus brunensis]ULG71987.1 histidine phosphatase family protein [Macrococcus brunensis]
MSVIYFVRHAERDTTIQENKSAPLTTNGHKKAHELKHFFHDKNIQAIYSSPYQRTVHTIEPTALSLGLTINLINDLRERKIGSWIHDFSHYSKQQWQDFDYKRENGESLNEVVKRLLIAYKEITNSIEGDIIVCGHGTAFAVLFHHLTDGDFGYEEWKQMRMPEVFSYDVSDKQLKKIKFLG